MGAPALHPELLAPSALAQPKNGAENVNKIDSSRCSMRMPWKKKPSRSKLTHSSPTAHMKPLADCPRTSSMTRFRTSWTAMRRLHDDRDGECQYVRHDGFWRNKKR